MNRGLPLGWSTAKLGEVAQFFDEQRKPVKESDRAKITGEHPYYGASGIIDYVNAYLFDGDYVLLGEDGENILSRRSPLAFRVSGRFWVNNHAHVLKPLEEMNIDYLAHYLESLRYERYNTGSAQPKLTKSTCEEIDVVVPPPSEQAKIAEVLDACDRLVGLHQQLIEAKQQRRLGIAQQLLTGKRRLPAFKQKWSLATFGQIFSTKDSRNSGSRIRNPITVGKYAIRPQQEHFNRVVASDNLENYNVIEYGDFVYDPMSAYYGAFGRYELNEPGIVSPVYRVLSINPRYDSDFMKHLIKSHHVTYQLSANSSQGNRHGKRRTIQEEAFDSISSIIPDIDEQEAIARVLNAFDRELALLERKLSLLKQQKQGLMQQLLTGKVRVSA